MMGGTDYRQTMSLAEQRALEILFLQEEVKHNHRDAENYVESGLTASGLAHALNILSDGLEKPIEMAQDTLDMLERNELVEPEDAGVYKLTQKGLRASHYLFGDFTMYGGLLEGTRCYFDGLCAERKNGEWRLL